jgi:hypothetical protein
MTIIKTNKCIIIRIAHVVMSRSVETFKDTVSSFYEILI